MDITTKLFEMGLGTWFQDIITILPTTVSGNTFQIGKQLATDVGFIYGVSTYADGLDADGNTLISTTQAQNLYVTFQTGSTQFFQQLRLSDLLNEFAGSPIVRSEKFMPVSIPTFDLSKSFYSNPAQYSSVAPINTSIRLKLWYIKMDDWKEIEKNVTLKNYLLHQTR